MSTSLYQVELGEVAVSRNIHELTIEALRVTRAIGLIGCVVESEAQRILAYTFDTESRARTFRGQSSHRWIPIDRPTTVLVHAA
jgi:hypothetical protein